MGITEGGVGHSRRTKSGLGTPPSAIFPRMRFAPRTVPATLILAALVLPWAMGMVAAPHDTGDHHGHVRPDLHHAKAVELVVHGHHHEPGTPLHQHTLVVAKSVTLTTKLSLALDLGSSVRPTEAPSNPATGFLAPHADLAHGPPLRATTSLILRI